MVRHSRYERARLIEQYHASGMTQAKFAHTHGVNVHTLHFWLAEERKKVSSTEPQPQWSPQKRP